MVNNSNTEPDASAIANFLAYLARADTDFAREHNETVETLGDQLFHAFQTMKHDIKETSSE